MDCKILLPVLTLDYFTEAKAPQKMLDIVFENGSQLPDTLNAQEKCKDAVFPFAQSSLKQVHLKECKVLLQRNDSTFSKEIREITIDFTDFMEYDWQPGDTIAILPQNANEYVNKLLELLELESKADAKCKIIVSKHCNNKKAKVPVFIPISTTPREILRDCLNLRSVLKKSFLRSLAEYCSSSEEIAFLKSISSKEGSSSYNDFIIKNRITLLDVLKLCPTCKPPLSLIVENLTRLLPRPYSITNSPLKTKEEISIIFSLNETNPGVTTNMLKEKCLDDKPMLQIYLRELNFFRYTEDNYQQNQILIAVGTGLAPFLGFLQHKYLLKTTKNKYNPGTTWLFVGATAQESIVYREDLLKWHSENVLNKFVESYSRSSNTLYHYVQNALESNSKQLVELLLKPETCLYLCADGGDISKSIENCLQHILSKELLISETESTNLLKDFKTNRKYREDLWL